MESYTIRAEDVGKRFLRFAGRTWSLSDSIGHVQMRDVSGKLIPTLDNTGRYFLQYVAPSDKLIVQAVWLEDEERREAGLPSLPPRKTLADHAMERLADLDEKRGA